MADDAMVSIAGSQDLQTQFGLTRDQAAFGLNAFSITGTLISDKCPQGRESWKDYNATYDWMSLGGDCDENHPWRAPDGSCNNVDNPLWGGNVV